MCGCSKKVPPPPPPPTQSFTLTLPDRRAQTFGSRLEAEAARVRAGGTGQIRADRA